MKKTEKQQPKKETFRRLLEKACKDIIYLSESDAGVEPFFGGKSRDLTDKTMLEAAGKSGTTPIEEVETSFFFDRVTKINEWYGEEQKKNAGKFAVLKKLLAENLSDLRVFKIGMIQIDIYIVGTDCDGKLTGVKTKAVET